jgi:hypothetical protein
VCKTRKVWERSTPGTTECGQGVWGMKNTQVCEGKGKFSSV